MAYTQWIPKNHLEVLEGHPERGKTSLFRKIYYPGLGGIMGLVSSLAHMYANRRPLYAGLHRHAWFLASGMLFGKFYEKGKEAYFRENEARLRYYIETHPAEFPDYSMVKIGDVLEPWRPNR